MDSLFDLPEFKKLLDSPPLDRSRQVPRAVDLCSNPLRRKEREHIEAIFGRLPDSSYKREVQNRLLSQDLGNHLGAWYELMVYDWLDGLGKATTLQPSIADAKSTPEFLVESDGLQVFIEVTVLQEAHGDTDVGDVWWTEATDTFRKIGDKLREKSGQHAIPPGSAYVICLGIESRLIELGDVKTYFIGGESVGKSGDLYPNLNGEIFEIHDNMPLLVKHRDVSALLVARRNRASIEDGYKLVFGLIQNPFALTPIPETEFGQLRRYVVVSETQTHHTMKWV